MRKTAGFLKFGCTLIVVLEVFVAIVFAILLGALLFVGSFSELAAKTGNAITVDGGTMTPAEMDALKPVILVAIAIGLAAIIFALLGTLKTRTVLGECKAERPFSQKSVDSLKASARLEIIGGLIGIIGSFVMYAMASNLKVNGVTVGRSMASTNLTFLIYAVEKYLLYHVAEYGHSLEKRV